MQNGKFVGLNREKKEKNSVRGLYDKKTASHSTVYLRSDEKSILYLKGWFTRHKISRQDLLVEK